LQHLTAFKKLRQVNYNNDAIITTTFRTYRWQPLQSIAI